MGAGRVSKWGELNYASMITNLRCRVPVTLLASIGTFGSRPWPDDVSELDIIGNDLANNFAGIAAEEFQVSVQTASKCTQVLLQHH